MLPDQRQLEEIEPGRDDRGSVDFHPCLSTEVEPRDGTDDRLAAGLDYLAMSENWAECESTLNQTVIRVYDLKGRLTRLDNTTLAAFVTTDGLFQLGHSKDPRPDLPQLKISLLVLDPRLYAGGKNIFDFSYVGEQTPVI